MLYKKIIYLLMLCTCGSAGAQTVDEVLKKMGNQYTINKPLQYKTSYALYKNFDSKKAEQSYNGLFFKNGVNEVYVKIGDTEILNSKTTFVKINHAEKAVAISKPLTDYVGSFDMKALYELCSVEKFTDYKSYWEITLVTKQYSALPYSKIIVQISKDYFLKKQFFYYNTTVNFSKDYSKPDLHYPKLEITYSDVSRNPIPASYFNSEAYYKRSDKNQIVLVERLKKYELIK